MEQDHIISEVRKNREELLAKFDNDLDRLFAHLKKKEEKAKGKVKNFQKKEKSSTAK